MVRHRVFEKRRLGSVSDPSYLCGMGQGSLPAFDNQMTNVEFLDNIGISSGDFFDIVDQMGDQDIMPNHIFDTQ